MSATRNEIGEMPARAASPGWRLRPAEPRDFEAIAAVRNACRTWEGMPATETADGVADAWKEPGCDLARDGVVAERADGTVIGADEVYDRGSHRAWDHWGGDVFPDQRGHGVEDALLAWAQRRAMARARELLGDDAERGELRLQVAKRDGCPAALTDSLARAGLRPLRSFLMMVAPLPDRIPAAEWPEGIRVETLRPDDAEHRRALWQGRVDSFADHWGAIPPDPALGLERFRHETSQDGFDPTLLWAARAHGGEVAGICFCRGSFRGDDALGFVGHLGVVPGWRRRGLARALLRHAMAELRMRGRTAIELGVDAEHPTGAREMYAREGFRERGRLVAWGMDLRPKAPGEGARR